MSYDYKYYNPDHTMKKAYRAIDLFAGIGGIRLGFEKAGFEIVYSNEVDRFCCQTYKTNFGEIDERDVCEVDAKEIPEFDILLAGFPCQPFSMAGEKKGFDDPRGNLFFQIERILKEKQPIAFFLENVKHLVTHRKGETFAVIMNTLQNKLGYKVKHTVFNSKNFGLPQNRERTYIVGFKDYEDFEFPTPPKTETKLRNILEKGVETKYYLSQRYYECLVRHKQYHQAKGNGWGFEVVDPEKIANSLVVGRMGRERNLIQESVRDSFYKENMDKSTKNSEGLRTLTPRECARLQGFPESFKILVSDNQAYRQFGNTVSVPVIKAIAKKIKKTLDKIYEQHHTEDVSSWKGLKQFHYLS